MKQILIMCFLAVVCLCREVNCQDTGFRWPGNAKAAVCLTYDDAIMTHLDIVIPDLNAAGLKGTFYLSGNNLRENTLERWKEAADKGHELGNHTAFHPCTQNFDWVPEEYRSEDYTVRRIMKELSLMNVLLHSIDGETVRSYAYPCGEMIVGGIEYRDSLRISGMFNGARGGKSDILKDMKQADLFNIPSWATVEVPGSDLISYVKQAAEKGTLAVFMFHGVGGDYLKVSREAHRELIDYLVNNSNTYWVAPLTEIAEHIFSEKTRLGW
jgi:peptidoglycan/xylan/chitin deacetylase (PgdA/CDA1 family)